MRKPEDVGREQLQGQRQRAEVSTIELCGANGYSSGDRKLIQSAAARSPAKIIKKSDISGRVIKFRLGKTAVDTLMRTLTVVIVLETAEFSLQILRIAKWHMIEVLAPDRADKSLHERVRNWHVWNCLEFYDLKDAQVGFPAVELEQRIVIRTEAVGQRRAANDPAEHPAGGCSIERSLVAGVADDSAGELV